MLTQTTRRNMPARLQAKWQLVQLLYRKGWTRQQVLDMLHVLDWMMRLPPHLNEQLWQNVAELPEEKTMSYMTSFEKIAAAKGLEQGLEQG
ncbi:MAG: cytosolic protein, partial [Alcaligenaceae bacterium]|nr:cytosolic protein [Alcaligenaceae bacterium]